MPRTRAGALERTSSMPRDARQTGRHARARLREHDDAGPAITRWRPRD